MFCHDDLAASPSQLRVRISIELARGTVSGLFCTSDCRLMKSRLTSGGPRVKARWYRMKARCSEGESLQCHLSVPALA